MAQGHRTGGDIADDPDPPPREGPLRRHDPPSIADMSERLRVWVHWVGTGRLIASAGAVAVVAALGWWLLRSPAPPTEARLTSAADVSTTAGAAGGSGDPPSGAVVPVPSAVTTVPTQLVVHVAGAVVSPGVFELPPGSRVGEAIAAAGGAAPTADPNALNLAAPLADGDRVAVPVAGETAPGAAVDGGVSNGSGEEPAGPVNVNTASVAALEELPGVGPATAQAIVAHRETNGPFASIDDLEGVRGIGPAKLEALRSSVTV